MKRDRNLDAGSALALVLIFVTILGGWLGVSLLLTQASATGGQRLSAQTTSASQVAVAASAVFEQLIIDPSLGSAAFDSSSQPNCGLATIISSVAWIVDGNPCATIATLSPTRMASASDAATIRAMSAS